MYKRQLFASLAQGLVALLLCLATVLALRALEASTELVRSAAFTVLVLGNLALLRGNRAATGLSFRQRLRRPNWPLLSVSLGAVTALALVLYLPLAQRLFRFEAPSVTLLLACLGAAALMPLWLAVQRRLGGDASRN